MLSLSSVWLFLLPTCTSALPSYFFASPLLANRRGLSPIYLSAALI
jgi:hypothetical protein